nr:hypothetical protein [Tanacetum cinerariifolium]
MTESPLIDSGCGVPVFSPGDDPIICLNKAMSFLIDVASSRFSSTNNHLRTSLNPRNQTTIQDGRVTVQQVQGRQDLRVLDGQDVQIIIPHNVAFQTEDLDTYDSDCDDISNAQAVLMANIFNYGSDVISDMGVNEPSRAEKQGEKGGETERNSQSIISEQHQASPGRSPNEAALVKDYQEEDKIGPKSDKNRKRGKAGKSQKQLQWIKEVKLNKTQKEGSETQTHTSFNKERRKEGQFCNLMKVSKKGIDSANV